MAGNSHGVGRCVRRDRRPRHPARRLGGIVFEVEAARIAAMPGVSVAVVVSPYHASAVPSGPEIGTLVVGRPGA